MVAGHGGTLFWSVITFLLLLVVLKKVAWGPIIQALETREAEIKDALSSADKARENAEKASKDYDDLVKKIMIPGTKLRTFIYDSAPFLTSIQKLNHHSYIILFLKKTAAKKQLFKNYVFTMLIN